jgi:transcriptional regulator with XRE-family HTH domain
MADERTFTLGSALSAARAARGLTLRQLAGAAELSPSHLHDVEHHRRSLSYDALLRVATALQLDGAALADEAGVVERHVEEFYRARADARALVREIAYARLTPERVSDLRQAVSDAAA